MIEFTETEVFNWRGAIRGARNSWESHEKSDSHEDFIPDTKEWEYIIGPNDHALLLKLANAGSSHAKWMRQVMVCVDINAPLYWFKEFDQYKVGTVTNSTSTMHTITKKPFDVSMFSINDMEGYREKIELKPNEINEQEEEWRTYPSNTLYFVSNQGRVKRKAYTANNGRVLDERILTNVIMSDGYVKIGVLEGDKRKYYALHRMVAETFIKNLDNKDEVNHIDGNRQNNHLSNLEWTTRSENAQHAHDNGLQTSNGKSKKKLSESLAKFSEEEREEIKRQHHEDGLSRRKLAKIYGVSHTCINDIINDKYFNIELSPFDKFELHLEFLEDLRQKFLETKDKKYWRAIIQMLPDSWMQKRTTTLNYAVIRNAYHDRKGHRLSEWQDFREWAESLPYSEFITGVKP